MTKVREKGREKGWWYPWIFVAFMGVVVAVNLVFMVLANKTWTGLETEGAYEKGLAYNKALLGAKAQAALGWRMDFQFTPVEGKLSAAFHGPGGEALTGMKVKALLIRPTREGFDFSIDLEDKGGGTYAAVIDPPLPGRWTVRIHAYRGADSFQIKREIMAP
ncbi:MAG TPA: hypothetical protein ENI79_01570 [Rhodospirillales bacterium]|nr:hypothetical protein [Rhodospirillales bacterium]